MDSWNVADWRPVPGDGSAPLEVVSSLTGRIEPVGPDTGIATLYVCGITPYDATHIGHANTYVAFDVAQRVWRDRGLQVHYAQNVTDVDDPLLERAERDDVDWRELARDQTDLYRDDMAALNVLPPDDFLGVTESIDAVVGLVEQLRDTGVAYQLDDEYRDWYFTTTSAPGWLDFSGFDEAQSHAVFAERGGDPDRPGKRDALDALLWRQQRPGEPAWDSPLGRGRPGWHVECAAIALGHLGPNFDVQGGGSDLLFPHHEMSAAHAAAVSGQPFAKAFVHSGMVGLGGQKMSKSRGNLVFVSTLRADGVDPMAIRLALLAHHYRSDWEWTAAGLHEASERLAVWRAATNNPSGLNADQTLAALRAALRDDLDTPQALSIIDTWVHASAAIDADDAAAPGIIATACESLLGVAL